MGGKCKGWQLAVASAHSKAPPHSFVPLCPPPLTSCHGAFINATGSDKVTMHTPVMSRGSQMGAN